MKEYELNRPGQPDVVLKGKSWLHALGRWAPHTSSVFAQGWTVVYTDEGRVRLMVGSEVWQIQVREASLVRDPLQALLEEAAHRVPSTSSALLVPRGKHLFFLRATGPQSKAILGVRIPRTTGIAGFVLQSGSPVIVGDAPLHPRHFRGLDRLTGHDTKELLALPLRRGGRVLGILELMNPPAGGHYQRSDLGKLRGIARRMIGALRKAEDDS